MSNGELKRALKEKDKTGATLARTARRLRHTSKQGRGSRGQDYGSEKMQPLIANKKEVLGRNGGGGNLEDEDLNTPIVAG